MDNVVTAVFYLALLLPLLLLYLLLLSLLMLSLLLLSLLLLPCINPLSFFCCICWAYL